MGADRRSDAGDRRAVVKPVVVMAVGVEADLANLRNSYARLSKACDRLRLRVTVLERERVALAERARDRESRRART